MSRCTKIFCYSQITKHARCLPGPCPRKRSWYASGLQNLGHFFFTLQKWELSSNPSAIAGIKNAFACRIPRLLPQLGCLSRERYRATLRRRRVTQKLSARQARGFCMHVENGQAIPLAARSSYTPETLLFFAQKKRKTSKFSINSTPILVW